MQSARLATVDDLVLLQQLWDLAVADVTARRGGRLLLDGLSAPTADQLGRSDPLVGAGCLDTAVVGYVVARLPAVPGGVASIESLYVLPEAREVGVGEELAGLVATWAAEHGCIGIDATALPGDRATKAFFETSGFVTRALTMHHPLPSGREDQPA